MKLAHAKYFVAFMTLAGMTFIGVLVVFLVAPTYRELRDLAAKIVEAETEVQAQYANRRTLLSSIEQLREVRLSMKNLGSQFVAKGQELSFIEAVENVGVAHGTDARLQLSGDRLAGDGVFKQDFFINVVGPYAPAMRTLADIERLPQLITVETLEIRGGETDAPDATTPVSINMRGRVATPPKGL